MTIIDIAAVAAVAALLAILWVRPSGAVGMALALLLVGTGIVVSWQSVERERQQQADVEAFYRRQAAAPVTGAPPPDHPHAGS